MRKSVVVLGIVLILGIAAMPAASAVTQTQRFVSILRATGFETELPEGGRWIASYPYKDICAIARIEFPNTPWESSKGRGLERLGRTGLLACQKHTTPGWGYVAEPQQSSFRPSARPRIHPRICSWAYSWTYPRVYPWTRCDPNCFRSDSGEIAHLNAGYLRPRGPQSSHAPDRSDTADRDSAGGTRLATAGDCATAGDN